MKKKVLLALSSLLIFASVSFAAKTIKPPSGFSNASLNGTYAMQTLNTHYKSWGISKTCPTTATTTATTYIDPTTGLVHTTYVVTDTGWETYQAGGQGVDSEFNYGTVFFDGVGTWTNTFVDYHAYDEAGTLAQYSITCGYLTSNGTYTTPTITEGQMLFLPPATMTYSGTYSIGTDGTGTLSLSSGGGGVMYLQIGGPPAVSTGPWTTVLVLELGSTSKPCTDCGSGIAVLQK